MFPLKKKMEGQLAWASNPYTSQYKNEGGERFYTQNPPPPPPSFKREDSRRLAVFAPPSHFWLHFAFIFGVITHSNK